MPPSADRARGAPFWLPLFSLAFLGALILVSWSHFFVMAIPGETNPLLDESPFAWNMRDLLTAMATWSLMMAGMMLPTAGPWIWSLSRAWTASRESPGWMMPAAFILGYLTAWTMFSVLAAALQWALQEGFAAAPTDSRPFLSGSILMLAGLYQWSNLKDRCLTHCRSPVAFFLKSWRPGIPGGFRMGLNHGLFCVGCCWLLMLLAFVMGIMNLLWMILLTVYVFIDHNLLNSTRVGNLLGLLLLAWGFWKLVAGVIN